MENEKIVLKSVFSKEKKLVVMPAKDPRTGWYAGVDRLSDDEKKKLKYWVEPTTKLVIEHNKEFDLSDETDRLNWEWVSKLPSIALSYEEAQQTKEALFYVENQEVESKKTVKLEEMINKATSYILKDRSDMLADRARLLGYDMEGESVWAIKELLLKIAKDPKTYSRIIDVYESNSTALHLLFLKARDKNIIVLENGAYLYGTTVLGVTEESVIKTLQDPAQKEIVELISKDLNNTSPKQSRKKEVKKD